MWKELIKNIPLEEIEIKRLLKVDWNDRQGIYNHTCKLGQRIRNIFLECDKWKQIIKVL